MGTTVFRSWFATAEEFKSRHVERASVVGSNQNSRHCCLNTPTPGIIMEPVTKIMAAFLIMGALEEPTE